MPISMCWPRGPTRQRSGESSIASYTGSSSGPQTPDLVDEAAEVRRDGRRPARRSRAARRRPRRARGRAARGRTRPASRSRGRVALGERRRARRSSAAAGRVAAVEALARRPRSILPSGAPGREAVPLASRGVSPTSSRKLVDLLAGEERRVVLRPAGDLQAVALDRVGEDRRSAGRSSRRARARARRGRPPRSWPPRSRTSGGELAGVPVEQAARAGRARSASSGVEQRVAHDLLADAPKSAWYCSFGISSIRRRSSSPPSRANASRSRRPYFSSITCQPRVRKLRSSSCALMPGIDAVERLAVEVDDPEHVAEPPGRAARRPPPRGCPRRARRRRAAR